MAPSKDQVSPEDETRLKVAYRPRFYWNYDAKTDNLFRFDSSHKLVLKSCKPADSMLPNSMLEPQKL